jgi:hypothetical protein
LLLGFSVVPLAGGNVYTHSGGVFLMVLTASHSPAAYQSLHKKYRVHSFLTLNW